MKKIFLFAAILMVAIGINAETVFDWAGNVGTTTMFGTSVKETVKVKNVSTDCISLKNGFKDNNGVKIAPASGSFLEGDIVKVEFCVNNSDAAKTAVLGIYAADSTKLTYASANNTYNTEVEASTLQYALTADAAELLLGRESGNTKCCITKLEVIRGGEIIISKAAKPVFSVAAGTYFDPFKVEITAPSVDKIYVKVNDNAYAEYTDSIAIDQYDEKYTISAYATLEGAENSDTVTVEYTLKHFVARPVFKYKKAYTFAGVAATDINILSGDNGELTTYKMDGKDGPSINYKHQINAEGADSVVIFTLKGQNEVTFRYKNGSDKNNVLKTADDFVQMDSKNFEIWVDSVKSGDTIVFVVTAKGSAPMFSVSYSSASYLEPYMPDDDTDPCFTDGMVMTASTAKIEEDYSGWQNLVYTVAEGGHSRIRIKETANGFRIAKILVGAYRGEAPQAVENVDAATKAVKFFENGQLIILKNGVRYNAIGAKL